MRTRIVALSVALIALAGCAHGPTERAGSRGAAKRVVQAGGAFSDESAVDIAHVVCEQKAVQLNDPVVRTHQDGVHFLIENPGGAWGVELHHESWANGTGEELDLRGEATPDTSAIAPGSVTVACLPRSHSSYDDSGIPTATLTIVDPKKLYVPWDLACGFGDQFRLTINAGASEGAADVFRRVPGVRPSDEFKPPKYPESPQYWPTVMVFRDGVPVARLMAPKTGNEWDLLINSCPGSGITET
jgi:hypothetical protein